MACLIGTTLRPEALAVVVQGSITDRKKMRKYRICVSEAEAVRDFRAVLARVRKGAEVIIRLKGQPVAIVRPAEPPRKTISECIALLPKDSTAVMDEEFAKDVQEAIDSHREPFDPPEWD